ncbi:MAG: hypothetical protein JRF37_08775, partial [Deltaproteobacteria bacterium]|nr:hypothetical protein [Deltaproteobacteria bacterium]
MNKSIINLFVLQKDWLLALLIFVAIGILIYVNTLNVPFYLDDLPNIEENQEIRLTDFSLKSLKAAVFESPCENRPIANISLALNYYFYGYNVKGYHVINIIIHVLASIFLFFLLRITLRLSMSHPPNPSVSKRLNPSIAA